MRVSCECGNSQKSLNCHTSSKANDKRHSIYYKNLKALQAHYQIFSCTQENKVADFIEIFAQCFYFMYVITSMFNLK